MLQIITDPTNAVLTSVAAPIAQFDDELRELATTMIATMHAKKGAGLAAPQVGIGKRLIVCEWENNEPIAMINPCITQASGARKVDEEGCLSLPNQWLMVERAIHITVEYLDLTGTEQSLALSDFAARVVQHEIDHLNGVLMTDRNKQLSHGLSL